MDIRSVCGGDVSLHATAQRRIAFNILPSSTTSPSGKTPAMTHKELKRLFGLKVQALRHRRGLTQEGLAEAIGKSVDTIFNIERGADGPRVESALDIANTLGKTLVELFDVEERADNRDRERRKAVEKIVALVGRQSIGVCKRPPKSSAGLWVELGIAAH